MTHYHARRREPNIHLVRPKDLIMPRSRKADAILKDVFNKYFVAFAPTLCLVCTSKLKIIAIKFVDRLNGRLYLLISDTSFRQRNFI